MIILAIGGKVTNVYDSVLNVSIPSRLDPKHNPTFILRASPLRSPPINCKHSNLTRLQVS